MDPSPSRIIPRNNGITRPLNQPQPDPSLQNPNQALPSLQAFNHLEEPNILSNIQKEKSSKGDQESAKTATKEKLKEFQIPAKWEWLPCNYELKREEKSIETHWSLSPTIQLIGNDQKNPPIMDISINLERQFMHVDDLGWNWHKSWNLPNLAISIKINDSITNDPILPPADLKAQLFAVKVLLNKSEQFKLYDLGLKGSTVQDLSEGQCTFSAIKFSSTSYNNDGVKFHLIVLIYIQDDTRSRACPRILYSRISPPIFVDSRKSARDSNVTRNKKIVCKYFDPFPADTFEKTFIKRNTKLNESKEEIIENSLGGLSQYFTAPNIRNKVKHPVFLAAKFSNCVRLFYNENLMKLPAGQEKKEEDMIMMMQKVLMESSSKEKTESANSSKAFDNKYFILLIEEPNNLDSFQLNKKISDYLDPIINDVLHIIFNSNIVPKHFVELPNKNLVNAYTNVYGKLINMRDNFPSQPSTPEQEPTTTKKKAKADSPKARNTRAKNPEVNRKRDKREVSSDEEEKYEVAEPVIQKKLKTEIVSPHVPHINPNQMIEEVTTASPRPPSETLPTVKPQPLVQPKIQQQHPPVQKKPDTAFQMASGQKQVPQKPVFQQKPEKEERIEIKNEMENGLDLSQLAKLRGMLGGNNVSEADLASLLKNNPRGGMMSDLGFPGFRQGAESVQSKPSLQMPGASFAQSAGQLSFGQQSGGDLSMEMLQSLPDDVKNRLLMNYFMQNSNKGGMPNKTEMLSKGANSGPKGFPFGQQQQVQPELSLLQNHPQFQLQKLQEQQQQLLSNDWKSNPMINQLLLQQQLGGYMMGGNASVPNSNFGANFGGNLLGSGGFNANSMQSGFQGLLGNLQGNSQMDSLLRGLGGGQQQGLNMASLLGGFNQRGGNLGNLPK